MNSIRPSIDIGQSAPVDSASQYLNGAFQKPNTSAPTQEIYGASLSHDLNNRPSTSLFASQPWIEALTATYGFDIKASTSLAANGNRSAILYSEISDIRGQRIISLPFSDYCDPLVDTQTDWQRLIAPILKLQKPVRFKTVFNDIPLGDERFSKHVCALWHGVDLTRSEDDLMAHLKDTARRNIRKARKHGVTIRQSSSIDDMRTFYGLHCHVRKTKYRLLAQPPSFFENLYTSFAPGSNLVIQLAELDGIAIAGILFLIHGDTIYYKFNASKDLECRPNDLLAWEGMLYGKRRGLARLDFGLSDLEQPGLIKFKRKFATEERGITQLQWAPLNYVDPYTRATGEVLNRLTRILTEQEVPDSISRATSDLLYRYFC